MAGNFADEYGQQLFPGGIVQLGSQKVRVTRWEVGLSRPFDHGPYMFDRCPYVFEPTVRFEGVFVTPQFLEGEPEMSCNEERPFVYMIIDRGSGDDGPQIPASIIVDRTTMLAKSPKDVEKRALYQLAQDDANADPPRPRCLESLEVLVLPFCATTL